jgi:uncharacterized membrane protein YtjA (UPF0391 family)
MHCVRNRRSLAIAGERGRQNVGTRAGQLIMLEDTMLYWALVFLVVAIIAGIFGFGGIAASASGIAQILFTIFLVLFLVSLITHVLRGRSPPL